MKKYRKKFLYAPNTVYLEVTNRCNLNCKHCYVSANKNDYELTLSEIEKLFKRLKEIGTFGVVLGGGEPLIRSDIIEIINLAEKYNLLVGISTNGSLIDDKFIAKTRGKISNIQISLDGANQEQFGQLRNEKKLFKKVVKSINLLAKNNFHVTVATVITKENLNSIEEIVNIAIDNGAQKYRAVRLIKTGNALKNDLVAVDLRRIIANLENIKKKFSEKISIEIDSQLNHNQFYCTAGIESISINYKGDINICSFLNVSEFCCGNILSDDIHYIWLNSRKLKKVRKRNFELPCDTCNVKQVSCLSNCIAYKYFNCSKIKQNTV